jgi:hypothetical protein
MWFAFVIRQANIILFGFRVQGTGCREVLGFELVSSFKLSLKFGA